MSAIQHYDAIVLGAGQAGVPLSEALGRSGRKTALIEREHVGVVLPHSDGQIRKRGQAALLSR
jgi:pyruvate/2-oxoglutarate dehydrogenase complex dihydrolipoamide dehydrogenase (E3) component